LYNSTPFDWMLQSQATEFLSLVQKLFPAVVATYRRAPRKAPAVREHLALVLANLFAARVQDPERWVGYSRERVFIDKHGGFDARVLLDHVVKGLTRHKLIEEHHGKQGIGLWDADTGRAFRARMRATDVLAERFAAHGLSLRIFRSSRRFSPIRLRDENKKEVPIPRRQKPRAKALAGNLDLINDLLERSFIGLHVPDTTLKSLNERLADDPDRTVIDFSRKRLFRVFNAASLERGGRFSGGWWQGVPSEYRPFIYIGGPDSGIAKPAAEVDFSSMFPSIAYALLGKEIDEMAYHIPSVGTPRKEVRKVIKQALLTMLMAEGPREARTAVQGALSEDVIRNNPERYPRQLALLRCPVPKGKKKERKPLLKEAEILPPGCPPLHVIIKELERKHEPLRSEFLYNVDKGRYLMYRESQIAERIMLEMLRFKAPTLPVHDSFLAMRSYVGRRDVDTTGDLDKIMHGVFKEELGVTCRVSFDETEREIETRQRGTNMEWAPPIKELGDQLDKEKHEYATFYRLHDDWYEHKNRKDEERTRKARRRQDYQKR
jgi:hypothetical protein